MKNEHVCTRCGKKEEPLYVVGDYLRESDALCEACYHDLIEEIERGRLRSHYVEDLVMKQHAS